ncbi:protein NRT1/ PTR FAMILY 1.2 isoform X2 [Vigna angularis]|uniref:protein NRT1/ PTR FAMILY 1.2 isoform X2 n=1 Tax=Phaseolus angularis TaxID=3914 RepID=UPI0022B4DBEA|nr:protein NRT1/ PTR FAMILY 1.2 isoform X2 [Vigna angularis]
MDSSGAANDNLLENGASWSSESENGKGGLRTMPFIIVNECLEKVASYGIMPNMIVYLMNGYGMAIVDGTKVMNTWSAMSNMLSIFGAFLSDSYFGRFLVISIGSFSSLLGLTILWLTAMIPELRTSCESFMLDCSSATAIQLAVLFISMGLISIGAGCIRPCSIAFGADQLTIRETPKNGRPLDSYFNWCLNKACIIRNPETLSNPNGSVLDPWSQCTVRQVESLKSLLRVLPMWSTGIFMIASQTTFSTVQANTMNRTLFGTFKMPAGSFNLVIVITVSIIIPTYDRVMVPLLAKYMDIPRGFSCRSRIGIGLLFVCASKATSAVVETMRRKTAIEEGFEDQPNAVIHMSVLWLVPEFVLLGFAEGFNPIGQVEFFYTYIPKSMSSFAMALFTLQLAAVDIFGNLLVSIVDKITSVGGNESWLSTNINKGHLNYYYALLTCLSILNYFYFLVICWAYGPAPEQKLEASARKEEEQFDYMELPTS